MVKLTIAGVSLLAGSSLVPSCWRASSFHFFKLALSWTFSHQLGSSLIR